MRALGVMSLLVAGASAGVVLSDQSTLDRLAHLTGVDTLLARAMSAQAAVGETDVESRANRVFSPHRPLMPATPSPSTAAAKPGVGAAANGNASSPVATVVETAALQPRIAAEIKAPAPVLVARAARMRSDDEAGRAELAREIQTELRRVGCYDGNIDGDWGPAAKRSMKSFIDRVNAALPIDKPDYILLTLVKGHQAKACGAGCGVGEVAVEGGRCVPKAVIAQPAVKRLEPRHTTAAAGSSWPTTVVAPPPPAQLAGPAPGAVWDRRVVGTAGAGAAAAPAAGMLPGRMAVGGPTDLRDNPAANDPSVVSPPPAASAGASAASAATGPVEASAPPAPPPQRKASSRDRNGYGNRGQGGYSRNDRTFKNPQVVREFFFGKDG